MVKVEILSGNNKGAVVDKPELLAQVDVDTGFGRLYVEPTEPREPEAPPVEPPPPAEPPPLPEKKPPVEPPPPEKKKR